MAPIADFISAFEKLKEDHVSELPRYVSLFTTLCDILGYKIQAYKALVYEINQDSLTKFMQDGSSIDEITNRTPWILPFEFTMASTVFVSEIEAMLGKVHELPRKLPEQGEIGILKRNGNFTDVDASFAQKRDELLEIIRNDGVLSKKEHQTMKEILAIFEMQYQQEKVVAFVIMLHLIQDGFFSVHDDGGGNLSLTFTRR